MPLTSSSQFAARRRTNCSFRRECVPSQGTSHTRWRLCRFFLRFCLRLADASLDAVSDEGSCDEFVESFPSCACSRWSSARSAAFSLRSASVIDIASASGARVVASSDRVAASSRSRISTRREISPLRSDRSQNQVLSSRNPRTDTPVLPFETLFPWREHAPHARTASGRAVRMRGTLALRRVRGTTDAESLGRRSWRTICFLEF